MYITLKKTVDNVVMYFDIQIKRLFAYSESYSKSAGILKVVQRQITFVY